MAKIHELTAESTLTDEHLFITQENSDSSETKSATLALLKNWLNGLTFEDIAQYFVEGTNVTINIDNETQKITITATGLGEKGDKGEDGVSPTAQIVQTDTGATITITDANGTTTSNLINGKDGATPYIDETTKHWFIDEEDTGIIAEGQDGKDGVTPYIDSETNHWIVNNVDTGINAEGTAGESPDVTVTQTDTGATITVVSGGKTTTANLSNGVTTKVVETTSQEFIGVLPADQWSESAPYSQTVTINGLTKEMFPIVDCYVYSAITDLYQYRIAAYNGTTLKTTSDSVVPFSFTEVPQIYTSTITSEGVLICWTPVKGATKYRVQRTTDSTWSTITYPTETNYTDTDVSTGTTYKYRVLAYVNDAWGVAGTAISISVPASLSDTGIPFIRNCNVVSSSVILEWEPVANATKYIIQRRIESYSSEWMNFVEVTNTSYIDRSPCATSNNEWSYITSATTDDNSITFYSDYYKPSFPLGFKVKVV